MVRFPEDLEVAKAEVEDARPVLSELAPRRSRIDCRSTAHLKFRLCVAHEANSDNVCRHRLDAHEGIGRAQAVHACVVVRARRLACEWHVRGIVPVEDLHVIVPKAHRVIVGVGRLGHLDERHEARGSELVEYVYLLGVDRGHRVFVSVLPVLVESCCVAYVRSRRKRRLGPDGLERAADCLCLGQRPAALALFR